jgi:Fe-S cluster biogenesis protein NfuA
MIFKSQTRGVLCFWGTFCLCSNDTVAAVAVVAGPDHHHQPESCCKSNIKPVTADRHDVEAAAATDGDDNILQLVMGACTRCLMYAAAKRYWTSQQLQLQLQLQLLLLLLLLLLLPAAAAG